MKKFETTVIYYLVDQWKDIKLCYNAANRKKATQIDAKYKTCSEVGMQTPALFASPKLAHEAGYPLKDVHTDELVPDDQIDKYDAVILEGHNRFWAWFNHLTIKEGDLVEEDFSFPFIYREFADSNEFRNAYHEINLNQEKTNSTDFANDLIATGGGNNKILVSYSKKVKRGIVGKAAGYATYNREFVKSDVVKLQKGQAPSYMSSDKILDYTDRIFTKVTEAFGCSGDGVKMHKSLRGSFIWKFNADKLKAVESDEKKLEAETQKLEKLYSTLPATSLFAISSAKATHGKTKEQVVQGVLQDLYDKI